MICVLWGLTIAVQVASRALRLHLGCKCVPLHSSTFLAPIHLHFIPPQPPSHLHWYSLHPSCGARPLCAYRRGARGRVMPHPPPPSCLLLACLRFCKFGAHFMVAELACYLLQLHLTLTLLLHLTHLLLLPLTHVFCSYSVDGGAASRLAQCAHAFVRSLFSRGSCAGWVQPKVHALATCIVVRVT